MHVWLKPHKLGSLLLIYVQPGAAVSGVAGVHGDRLKLKVKAPPRDGEANAAVRTYLAELLGTSKTRISFLRGESSRQKDLVVELPPEDVLLRFEGLL